MLLARTLSSQHRWPRFRFLVPDCGTCRHNNYVNGQLASTLDGVGLVHMADVVNATGARNAGPDVLVNHVSFIPTSQTKKGSTTLEKLHKLLWPYTCSYCYAVFISM